MSLAGTNEGRSHDLGEPLPAIVLRSSEFRRGREQGWRDLEALVAKAEKRGIGALDVSELQRLPQLYRAALSSLSVARSIALDRNLLQYLDNLSLRAFLMVYGPRQSLLEGARDFLTRGFPAAVRAAKVEILLAFLAILAGTLAGFFLTIGDEAWLAALIPDSLGGGRGAHSTRQELLDDEIFAPWPGFARSFVVFANFLFQHNTIIGIMTFGLGIAAGAPTVLLLAYQGLVFGAFIGLHYDRGLTLDFLGWVSIHGVTEFGAIILCGAGGLVVAKSILFPGRFSRVENLAINGQTAARLAVGAVAMFFVAGLLEGGLRQLVANTEGRLAISALTMIAWGCYFSFAGRGARA
ncbi:stage II sporulation protein M [Methylocapsa sp. S129]|uniref:stage II sporulation protein M n=1 Tax=Methylocapsa sp. S129 TaxID=1641869 RepID=UPI001FEE0D9E|nr:stage II sporulation protein M [Methylocapsa sp. S129]